jgi:putative aminopeptidase FrvX
MHTTVETISIEDMDNVTELIYHSVLALKAGQDFRYIH